jgi:aerobic-type carbon monoxide dehydrogenase small subunit (CoxS/CutS family)
MPALTLVVNGVTHEIDVEGDARLLTVLRDVLGLTGTKYGCGEGQCGACTVLAGDRAVRSCVTPAHAVAGGRITTIEGLAVGDRLHPVQQAFLDAEALQCGYCTPGMIVGAVALLRTTPKPDRTHIVRAMNGHICRCGIYSRIVTAIEAAAGAPAGTTAARRDR